MKKKNRHRRRRRCRRRFTLVLVGLLAATILLALVWVVWNSNRLSNRTVRIEPPRDSPSASRSAPRNGSGSGGGDDGVMTVFHGTTMAQWMDRSGGIDADVSAGRTFRGPGTIETAADAVGLDVDGTRIVLGPRSVVEWFGTDARRFRVERGQVVVATAANDDDVTVTTCLGQGTIRPGTTLACVVNGIGSHEFFLLVGGTMPATIVTPTRRIDWVLGDRAVAEVCNLAPPSRVRPVTPEDRVEARFSMEQRLTT